MLYLKKLKMRILLVMVLVMALFSCVRNKNIQDSQVVSQPVETPEGTQIAGHVVEVKEVVQGSSYTYMLVTEHGVDNWIAVNKQEANVGWMEEWLLQHRIPVRFKPIKRT